MELGSFLLILAVALLTAAFIAYPILRGESHGITEPERKLSSLLAERERLMDALLELDFDHELGKVPQEIYAQQRRQLMDKAANVLAQLDTLAPALDADQSGAANDPIEALIAARSANRQSTGNTKFCPQCGQPIQPGDQFCVSCGTSLV
jgi:hypothetical protein